MWTTICDEHWDHTDASIVCRQLGFSANGMLHICILDHVVESHDCEASYYISTGALALKSVFTEGVWPLTITNITCNGSESNLLECSYSTERLSACHARRDASVSCQSMCSSTLSFV